MKSTCRILLPAILIGWLVVMWVHLRPFSRAESACLEVRMSSDQAGRARLYFDRGNGFVAYDAVAALVQPGKQVVRFPLPDASYTAFRLWPLDRAGKIGIEQVAVLNPQGATVRVLQKAVADGGGEIESKPGEGPEYRLESAVELKSEWKIPASRGWSDFAIATAVTALVLALGRLIPEPFTARLTERLGQLRRGLERAPRLMLLLAAGMGTLLSCYPVILAGRSFVSPGNGALLLYDDMPTLPGAPMPPTEDARGSDTGAVMWAHVPYSVIEHRAIFHDGEWPLWNRNNYCGVPLLGQGMSMLGDPLHWVAIANGGAAWAWDVKFLLAKTVFALGIGLCVRLATGRLWLAAIVAVSASFLGFFHYRFNHPAFFAMAYAPWILHAWMGAAKASGRLWPWALAIAAANFFEFNTGVMKESTMLIAGLNFTGLLVVLFAATERRGRRVATMLWGCALFVLLAAPFWMIFLEALRNSWTPYDTPRAFQIPPMLALGLFDDLFYRPFTSWENHYNPSANFFIFLGVVWAVIHLRSLLADRELAALVVGAVPSAALAFGLIPAWVITKIPFLANIEHVDNTFSVVLIVHLIVVGAYGLGRLWDRAKEPGFGVDAGLAWLVIGGFLTIYLGAVQVQPREIAAKPLAMTPSPVFLVVGTGLVLAWMVFPWLLRSWRREPNFAALLGLGLLGFLFHFRHGMWTETKFDYYVMNPQGRSDLQAHSQGLQRLIRDAERQSNPYRVAGYRSALVPGFQAVYGLEHFAGADALVGRYQRELCTLLGTPPRWGWRWQLEEMSPAVESLCQLWGIRWLAAMPCDLPNDPPTADLTLKELPQAWPRAFFTDRLLECNSLENFAVLLPGSAPFAATTPTAPNSAAPVTRETVTQVSRVPARDYRLTSNTTSFQIDAPAAGVAVLTETYEPENWRVTLDGRPVDYFRVNHAYLGVKIDAPGAHALRFEYWPRRLTLALWLGATGAFLLLLTPLLARMMFGAPPLR